MAPFSHKRAKPAQGEGHSSPCLKAGAFWPQKGKTPDPAYMFADNSYVFSVSVAIIRSTSRTLVAFGPGLPQFGPQANAEFIGTSV
jgi:hypothetical protein